MIKERTLSDLEYYSESLYCYSQVLLRKPVEYDYKTAVPLFYKLSIFQRIDCVNNFFMSRVFGQSNELDDMDFLTLSALLGSEMRFVEGEIRRQKMLEKGEEINRCINPSCCCLQSKKKRGKANSVHKHVSNYVRTKNFFKRMGCHCSKKEEALEVSEEMLISFRNSRKKNDRSIETYNDHELNILMFITLLPKKGYARKLGIKCHSALKPELERKDKGVFKTRVRIVKYLKSLGYEPDHELIYFKNKCFWNTLLIQVIYKSFFTTESVEKAYKMMNLFWKKPNKGIETKIANNIISTQIKSYEEQYTIFEDFKDLTCWLLQIFLIIQLNISKPINDLLPREMTKLDEIYFMLNYVCNTIEIEKIQSLWKKYLIGYYNSDFFENVKHPKEYRKLYQSRKCCVCEKVEGFDVKKIRACGRCKYVYYCSLKCQKKDWIKSHRKKCKEFELERKKEESRNKRRK